MSPFFKFSFYKMKIYFKNSLIVFETFFLLCGVYLPLVRTNEFWFFSSEFSVISITRDLFINGEVLLSAFIILFGFIMPFIKIILKIFELEFFERFNLHKFAMVDIFLIAFIVFASKSSSYFEVYLMYGFYFLLASVLMNYIYVIFIK